MARGDKKKAELNKENNFCWYGRAKELAVFAAPTKNEQNPTNKKPNMNLQTTVKLLPADFEDLAKVLFGVCICRKLLLQTPFATHAFRASYGLET